MQVLHRTWLALSALLLLGWPVPATGDAFAAAADLATFADRRQAMLAAACRGYEADPRKPAWKNAFLVAAALFESGKIEEGRRMAGFALDGLVPGNRINRWYLGGNSGFVVWPGIDCYIRYEHLLGDELKARFKQIYTTGVFYRRFSTSNHVTMAGVTRFLAVQTWGREAFSPHPDYADKVYEALPPDVRKTTRFPPSQLFSNDDPDAVKFVHQLVEQVVARGPGEYASRPYGAENTLPLLSLAECAKDPALRAKARLAYEVSLLQLAPTWLRGHLATFAPRSYPDMETQQPWGIAALVWLYYGGVPPADIAHEWALRAATSSYHLPAVAVPIGADRTRPFRHRALVNGWALDHHVTPGYALFARSPKHALATGARMPFQGQSYPCGLMWDEPDVSRSSHLWITCPAADDNADPKNTVAGLHTHGVTPHEQEVLHGDALVWAFDIPPGARNPYVLGFIPGGARAVIDDATSEGRLYLHYGSVLVGLAASQPFPWDPAAGIRAPAGKPPEGCAEFRIACRAAAVAIEAGVPGDFGAGPAADQLAAFRAVLRKATRIECTPGEKPVARYVDRHGNRLECTFDGEDRVNGAVVDYRHWPILDNPWTVQTTPEQLVIGDGETVRTYDFRRWKVTEAAGRLPPAPPP